MSTEKIVLHVMKVVEIFFNKIGMKNSKNSKPVKLNISDENRKFRQERREQEVIELADRYDEWEAAFRRECIESERMLSLTPYELSEKRREHREYMQESKERRRRRLEEYDERRDDYVIKTRK